MKISAQLYTVREDTKTATGFREALRKIADIGYRSVQLSAVGAMDGDAPELTALDARAILDELGLESTATHRPLTRLQHHADEEIEFHRALGAGYAAIGIAPQGYFEGEIEGFRQLADDLSPIVDRLDRAGIEFGYHNHAVEFGRFGPERRTLFETLVEHADPRLKFEIDTYWVVHAGTDLVDLIERLSGRLPVVHLKDREMVGWEADFAPVGEGNLPWPKILKALESAGTHTVVVEQDICRRDPYDCLASSLRYLRKLVPDAE